MSNDSTDNSADHWSDWPVCPQCQAKRQACCPICKSAGTHFELADFIPATQVQQIGANESAEPAEPVYDDSTVLLMCDACDEAFSPKFYARCHTCGHEFPDGLRIENTRPTELSRRALAVLFGIATILFALFAFFAWTLK